MLRRMSLLPPPLAGRVALVTGANTGIGKVTARVLAEKGAHVFIACRSAERAQPVVDEIRAQHGDAKVELLSLDLGDFASVRACAEAFLGRGLPLHLLINNAGLSPRGGQRSKSGFELGFGVNHMGHFLLTSLLLARIRESAPARIASAQARTEARSPRSSSTYSTLALPVSRLISSITASVLSFDRHASRTCAPARASSFAVILPMPVLAPVMR